LTHITLPVILIPMSKDITSSEFPISRFTSRYGDLRTIWKVSEDEYKMTGKSRFVRAGNDDKRVIYIDLEGGPFVAIGEEIALLGVVSDKRFVSALKFNDNEKDLNTDEEFTSVSIMVSTVCEKVEM